MTYRTASAEFRIAVENPEGVCRGVRSVEIDGVARADMLVPLANAPARTPSASYSAPAQIDRV